MEERVLAFYSYNHLGYWYREIRKFLESLTEDKELPPIKYRATSENSYIDFGTQRWIFLVPHGNCLVNNLIGRRGPIYHGTEYLLEEDFKGTLSKIWKGE